MELRPYQQRVIDEAREKLRDIKKHLRSKGIERGPRLLLRLPTGAGKTVLASFIVQSHLQQSKNPRVRFMAHRDFLIDQTSGTFDELNIDHSFIAAGRWMNNFTPVHVCMVPTVAARLSRYLPPSLTIWDECQHIAANSYAKILKAWEAGAHIGLSATPCRGDGKGLDEFFDDMVIGPSEAELMRLGALSDYTYYAPSTPDLSGMRIRMGDYAADDLNEEMGKAAIIGNLVEHYGKYARGKKAVYFCTSIKNSRETVDAFNANGFRFVHLDGDHSTWEREQAALMLARGELDGISNVGLFGEGYDLAAQAKRAGWTGQPPTIEAVGIARPTKSLGLSRQMIGRVLRAKDYPGIILDHAGHLKEHGLPDDDVEWSLKGVEKSNRTSTYQCEGCGAEVPTLSPVCKACGHKHDTVKVSRGGGPMPDIEHIDGELQEVDRDAIRRGKKLEEWQCGSLKEFMDLGKQRGYQHPEKWAAHMWTLRKRRNEAKEHAARQQTDFFERVRA